MTVIAAVRCKDGTLVTSDALVTEGGKTFRSGPKYKVYGDPESEDCVLLGMAGIAYPWPPHADNDTLAEWTKEHEHVQFLKVSKDGLTTVEDGRAFDIIDPTYAIGSGASCAVGALALLAEGSHGMSMDEAANPMGELLHAACRYATSCEPPLYTAKLSCLPWPEDPSEEAEEEDKPEKKK